MSCEKNRGIEEAPGRIARRIRGSGPWAMCVLSHQGQLSMKTVEITGDSHLLGL